MLRQLLLVAGLSIVRIDVADSALGQVHRPSDEGFAGYGVAAKTDPLVSRAPHRARGFPSPRILKALESVATGECSGTQGTPRASAFGVPPADGRVPPQASCSSVRDREGASRCAQEVLSDLWSCAKQWSPGPLAAERALSIFLDDRIVLDAAASAHHGDCGWFRHCAPCEAAVERARGIVASAFESGVDVAKFRTVQRPEHGELLETLRRSCAGRQLLVALGGDHEGGSELGLSRLVSSISTALERWTGALLPVEEAEWVDAAHALDRIPRWACRADSAVLVLMDELLGSFPGSDLRSYRAESAVRVIRESPPECRREVKECLAARFPGSFNEAVGMLEHARVTLP